jgi:hypothetical protein
VSFVLGILLLGRDAIKPFYARRPSDQPVKLTVGWRIPHGSEQLIHIEGRPRLRRKSSIRPSLQSDPSGRCRLADSHPSTDPDP